VSRPKRSDLPRLRVEVAAVAVSVVLAAVLLLPLPVQLRLIVAVLFVMFGPGTALVTLIGWRFADMAPVGLVIGLGMALTAVAAELIIQLGIFDPRLELVLAAIAVVAVIAWSWRRYWPPGRAGSAPAAGNADRPEGPRVGDNEPPMSVGEGG